jgi:chemotaxis protein methyltransferase CheR
VERKTFERFREIIYEQSGITLSQSKEALVSSRIGKRMRTLGLSTQEQYLDHVLGDSTGAELVHLLDAISTNVTSFFRESHHFEVLDSLLRDWWAQGQRRFRIWSAASSTGEEPYTIAITAREALGAQVDLKILATDISTRVLERCSRGEYEERQVETVPPELLKRYFDAGRHGDETIYRVKPILRDLLTVRRLNLSTPPFPMRGPFDVVFCRNVMIYFDNDVRLPLLGEIHRVLKPNGYLMVGHSESLTGMVSDFRSVRPSVYTK